MIAAMRWVVALVVALAGCLDPDLVTCPNGRVCARGQACDTVHGECIDPAQQTACDGVADGSACAWAASTGDCFSGTCIVPGCGNFVVEAGEQCDDGNRVSGDGCSADCLSNEACGNGVVDVLEGEQCDDGNLRSHDLCDSTCQREAVSWSLVGIGPTLGAGGHGVFDVAHHALVHYADGITWLWDGTAWTIAATTGPPADPGWYALVYDTDRQVVVLVGTAAPPNVAGPIDVVWDWDGSAWHDEHPTVPDEDVEIGLAAYDEFDRRVVVWGAQGGSAVSFGYDPSVQTFTELAGTPPPDADNRQALAYDGGRNTTVLVLGGFISDVPATVPSQTWELTDLTWSLDGSAQLAPGAGVPALVYDDQLGELVGVGGVSVNENDTDPFTYTAAMVALAGTADQSPTWGGAGAPLPIALDDLELVYDPTDHQLIAFGGRDGTFDSDGHDDVYVLPDGGTAWATADIHAPHEADHQLVAVDAHRGDVVLARSRDDEGTETTEVWTWTGSWQRVAAASASAAGSGSAALDPVIRESSALAYDPVRDAIVYVDGRLARTYAFDATAAAWTALDGSGGVLAQPIGLAFDPVGKRLLALSPTDGSVPGTYALASDGSGWQLLPVAEPALAGSITAAMAYDARDGAIAAISNGAAFEMAGVTWTSTLSPGDGYTVVADARRGTLDYIHPTLPLVERLAGSFVQTATDIEPVPVGDGVAVDDPVHGRHVVIGTVGVSSRVLLVRTVASSLPDETCEAGVDADGDGEAGSADDDCWWQFAPACPPFTTCP